MLFPEFRKQALGPGVGIL